MFGCSVDIKHYILSVHTAQGKKMLWLVRCALQSITCACQMKGAECEMGDFSSGLFCRRLQTGQVRLGVVPSEGLVMTMECAGR